MTVKYKMPTVGQIMKMAATEEGRDNLISDFRTETDNLSLEEAILLKNRLDEEVGMFVDTIQRAYRKSCDSENYDLEENLYVLEAQVVNAYGFDSYEDGEWINSDY